MSEPRSCWCGNTELSPFSSAYVRCPRCETLVVAEVPNLELSRVRDDERDFYGREYWFAHQEQDLGYTNIVDRARTDLADRCVHWLRVLLTLKRPPGRALELGSAHGGFVALMHWAGFEAQGLELSPWIVEFARRTFGVPMLLGPVEDQAIPPESLDVIALMDVLEHLPDPMVTMGHCLGLLKPDGLLLIQTPRYVEGRSFEVMTASGDPFLDQMKMKAEQHLHLFSERSVRELFDRLGAGHVRFEPPMFPHYDMFLAVSRSPFVDSPAEEVAAALAAAPPARLVQALLDVDARAGEIQGRLDVSEADRTARLEVIERQGAELGRVAELEAQLAYVEADSAERLRIIEQHAEELARLEEDRAARLEVIERQGAQLARLAELEAQLAYIEVDRAARLQVIERQAAEIARLEAAEKEVTKK